MITDCEQTAAAREFNLRHSDLITCNNPVKGCLLNIDFLTLLQLKNTLKVNVTQPSHVNEGTLLRITHVDMKGGEDSYTKN